jgi:uncharacterized membrane protein YfcA
VDLLQLVLLGVIGIVGGVLSGLVGVGGGIVFVPGLVFAGGWEIQEAVAASLVIIVFSSLSGTIGRLEDGRHTLSHGGAIFPDRGGHQPRLA